MKRIFFLIIFFFIIENIKAQSVSYSLDKANGFKEFHFQDNKSKWKDSLRLDYGAYYYTGSCCPTGFGMPLSNISLKFDSLNHLISILVATQSGLSSGAVKYMMQYMTEAYGEPVVASLWKDKEDEFPALQWDGKKITLTIMVVESSVNPGTYGVMLMYNGQNPNPVYNKDY